MRLSRVAFGVVTAFLLIAVPAPEALRPPPADACTRAAICEAVPPSESPSHNAAGGQAPSTEAAKLQAFLSARLGGGGAGGGPAGMAACVFILPLEGRVAAGQSPGQVFVPALTGLLSTATSGAIPTTDGPLAADSSRVLGAALQLLSLTPGQRGMVAQAIDDNQSSAAVFATIGQAIDQNMPAGVTPGDYLQRLFTGLTGIDATACKERSA